MKQEMLKTASNGIQPDWDWSLNPLSKQSNII